MTQAEWFHCENWMQDGMEAVMASLLIESGHISRDSRVLGLGSGLVPLSGDMRRAAGAKVFVVEDSHVLVEQAKAIAPDIAVFEGSALSLPFREAVFDVVIVHQNSLPYSAMPEVLCEAARVLKADGRFLILSETHRQMLGRITSHYFPSLAAADALRYPDAAELIEKASEYGLSSCCTMVFGNGPVAVNQQFLRQVRRFGQAMLDRMDSREYAEGLMKLEEDYYGHPFGHTHEGSTLAVLVKDIRSCLPLSRTA